MRRVFFRELKPYSLACIADELDIDPDHARVVIALLLERGLLRLRKDEMPDQHDAYDCESCHPDELYQFVYVGIIIIGDCVIVVYPKYFQDRMPRQSELKQLFRVLRKAANASRAYATQDDGTPIDETLPTMLALLELYGEHGVYTNFIEGREKNGPGVIDWTRTIGQYLPMVDSEQPIYIDFESRKTFRDDSDFITRLHGAALTECSTFLSEAGLMDLLSLDEVWLSDEDADQFGDVDDLSSRLDRERGAQFVDWKIAVLELLERYLLKRESLAEETSVLAVGTSNFPYLWEVACKVAFGDMLSTRLDSLGIQLENSWRRRGRDTLLQIIPRPKWERLNNGRYSNCGEVGTLIPDTVVISSDVNNRKVFCIYDAKYYVPSRTGKIAGQPRLESVTKQFLYQSAYRTFILDHQFARVVNAFLVPSSEDASVELAQVSFPKIMDGNTPPFDDYIHMWAIPATRIFDAYLQEQPLDEMSAELIKESEGA